MLLKGCSQTFHKNLNSKKKLKKIKKILKTEYSRAAILFLI